MSRTPDPTPDRRPVTAQVVTVDDHQVVVLSGELDLSTAPDVRAVLARMVGDTSPGQDLHVDLTGVTFCDSSGLIVLVDAHKLIGDAGGRVVLLSPQPAVMRTLLITGLNKLFEIRERMVS